MSAPRKPWSEKQRRGWICQLVFDNGHTYTLTSTLAVTRKSSIQKFDERNPQSRWRYAPSRRRGEVECVRVLLTRVDTTWEERDAMLAEQGGTDD